MFNLNLFATIYVVGVFCLKMKQKFVENGLETHGKWTKNTWKMNQNAWKMKNVQKIMLTFSIFKYVCFIFRFVSFFN